MDTTQTMRMAGETGKALPRKIKFTVASLTGVKPPADGRITVYDTKTPGLAYTVTSKGAKAFYFVGRHLGRPRRIRLGSEAMAIDETRAAIRKLVGGEADPVEQKRQQRRAGTLAELWEGYRQYLEARSTAKTLITDTSRYETCLAEWGARRVLDIGAADIRELHAQLGTAKGHVTANRAVQLLRRIYNFARLAYNPVQRGEIRLFRETSRTRFLSPAELQRFLAALADVEINPLVADVIRLSLFTGARRANCQAARDEEFNMDAMTWTIPAGKSKNAEAMTLPLVPQAAEIVRRHIGNPKGGGWLFPSYSASGHVEEVKFTFRRILEKAGLAEAKKKAKAKGVRNKPKPNAVRFHDLRRTFGSWMAGNGVNLPTIGRALGHKRLEATQIYSRLDLAVVRSAAADAVNAMTKAVQSPK